MIIVHTISLLTSTLYCMLLLIGMLNKEYTGSTNKMPINWQIDAQIMKSGLNSAEVVSAMEGAGEEATSYLKADERLIH